MDRTYYVKKLSASRLERVYAVAGARVRQYLQAEIDHVAGLVHQGDCILELGCGYGRVLLPLARIAGLALGVDNSLESIRLLHGRYPESRLAAMDAGNLAFKNHCFDCVLGIQNFISACKVPARQLLMESLRITRPGGRIVFSSYADQFWPHRLEWFRRQAHEGLLGPIDEAATGNGVIACADGFRSSTFTAQTFQTLVASCHATARIYIVDDSSLFCEIRVPEP